MKPSEIKTGGRYHAVVSRRPAVVRVLRVRERNTVSVNGRHRASTVYDVLNERTGRECVFRSSQKFLRPADPEPALARAVEELEAEGPPPGFHRRAAAEDIGGLPDLVREIPETA